MKMNVTFNKIIGIFQAKVNILIITMIGFNLFFWIVISFGYWNWNKFDDKEINKMKLRDSI